MNIEQYKEISEAMAKVVEYVYYMPDSRDATELETYVEKFNAWDQEFLSRVIDLDECLKKHVT